ncbi:MAG TPA: TIGR04283 family arsenosugar biosynthesis glycosyltransferase [Burkholderiales bacterium]|nr:TIGR04283 family arsenosugar biosynthesis glycosyltransferase [Burkholderiales bacterium]
MPHARLSIIIPCLNEAREIGATLLACRSVCSADTEIIVVDGGSEDGTREIARTMADVVLLAPRGRASQMNAGALRAHGEVLLFLHADSRLPADAETLVLKGLARTHKHWGRFDVAISGSHRLLPVIAALMNVRSRWTRIATGDQGLFVTRTLFESAGRFPDIPLMEDIAFSAKLAKTGAPLCIRQRVTTSGRRWEKHGVWRTILLMWRLRFAYWRGVNPVKLATRYAPHRST